MLFKNLLSDSGTVITDTDIKQYALIEKIQKKRKLKILTIGSKSNTFTVLKHKIFKNYQFLEIKYGDKMYSLKIHLYGSIQIKNLLMAVLASKACGLKIKDIFKNI